MQITKSLRGSIAELELQGRLDALWADHVETAIAEAVRQGHHRVMLDMAEVDFLSSAGIRVLLKFQKQLAGIDGRLSIVRASPFVAEVLATMGLERLIVAEEVPDALRATTTTIEGRRMESESAQFEIAGAASGAGLVCRVLGDPSPVVQARAEKKDCRSLSLPSGLFALGIGTPGRNFDECRERFGEFLAVEGDVAFLPTDHAHVPDYLAAQGDFVPQLQVLHALACEGELTTAVAFRARPDASIPLLELVDGCLLAVGSDAVGMVVAAETNGLVGAALRKSPVGRAEDAEPFRFPDIRDWIKFTAEPAFRAEVVLLAGVAWRKEEPRLASVLRPLGREPWPQGHFHAAAFSYCPLRRRGMVLAETVRDLFERQRLLGLLHLIHDTRPAVGVGQSEFVRGTCWVSPITRIEIEAT